MSAAKPPRDREVQSMFDRIAGRYDLLNRIISFRLDTCWRKIAVRAVLKGGKQLILDLGSGTGDLAFAAAKAARGSGRIIGLDFSFEMLRIAQAKRSSARHGEGTSFVLGSALQCPFRDAVFDGVMTAFVLRNVSDLRAFFAHAFRVLKPGGRLVSLDMFPSPHGFFSFWYTLYFHRLMPWIGGVLAHDRKAYEYLSRSVKHFDPPEAIASLIEGVGFERVATKKYLRGAVCIHVAEKLNLSRHHE